MVESGAKILDIGGESSRPGASAVSPSEEQRRVLPVLEALADLDVVLSVDTYHSETVRAAISHGAGMINDITGGRDLEVVAAVAEGEVAYALMHMQGSPQTMQLAPKYRDVVAEVSAYLQDRFAACRAAGIRADRLVVDPGFGFGKTLEHNLALLRCLSDLRVESCPILVGLSRKTMIGRMTRHSVDARLPGSLAAMLACLAKRCGSCSRARCCREHGCPSCLENVQRARIADLGQSCVCKLVLFSALSILFKYRRSWGCANRT